MPDSGRGELWKLSLALQLHVLNGHRTLHSSKTKDYMERVVLMDWLQSVSNDEGFLHLLRSLVFLKRVERKKTEVTRRTALGTETPEKNTSGHNPSLHRCPDCAAPSMLLWGWGRCPGVWRGEKSELPQPTQVRAEGGSSALLPPQTVSVPGDGARWLFRLVSSSAWYKYLPASTEYFLASLISVGEGAVGGVWSSICSEITLASSLMKLFYLSCFEIKMEWSFS